jgi:2-(1,2-epoxy-1,2-dihydrophenyl)acetyl-CoA isomerase
MGIMISTETLIVEQKGQLVIIRLNRPEVYNSFNKEMAMGLQEVLDECEKDENCRAIIITGVGKAFCAGQDLKEAIDNNGIELDSIVTDHYNPIITRIRNIEKPVVSAVNGVAAGAGANIALACDICVAIEGSNFIQAFSKIGLIPDNAGTFFLPRIIGFQKASALIMLGDKVDATEAESMGMIYKVFNPETFVEDVEKLGLKLASMPTMGLGLTKRALNQSLTNSLSEQLALESDLQTEAAKSEDYQEGVQAFLEKRKPEFKGK